MKLLYFTFTFHYLYLAKFLGKGMVYLDCGGKNLISTLSSKKKKTKTKLVCYLDLSNVLGVLYTLLHSIEKQNLQIRCYQYSHFIDEESEARDISKVTIK